MLACPRYVRTVGVNHLSDDWIVMLSLNVALLEQLGGVLLPDAPEGATPTCVQIAASGSANLRSAALQYSRELADRIASLPEVEAVTWVEHVQLVVSEAYAPPTSPMYPNFPQQVMDLTDAELYLNALVHYTGDALGVRLVPAYEKDERPPLAGEGKVASIRLLSKQDVISWLAELMSSKVALSPAQVEALHAARCYQPDLFKAAVPAVFTNGENFATCAPLLLLSEGPASVLTRARTATDVLRVAATLSGCLPSLQESTAPRFRSFTREERRAFLAALNSMNFLEEDFARHATLWVRLGERLHPGEYARQFPSAAAAFAAVRNGRARSFASRVEQALLQDPARAALLLQGRPGEFVRRLDHMLRLDAGAATAVLNVYESVAPAAPTVLLQALAALRARRSANGAASTVRLDVPARGDARVRQVAPRAPIDPSILERAIDLTEDKLIEAFTGRPSLGRVYVDPALKSMLIPFGLRSTTRSLRTVGRGSRLPLPEGDTVRLFMHWRQPEGVRVDLDLSALFLDEKGNERACISYYDLRSELGLHSGDFTSAPSGAAEFVDVNIQAAREKGIRYVCMSVLSFNRVQFANLPESFAGFMMRQAPQSGEVFEASTVQDRFDVLAAGTATVPLILDVQTREVIWADLMMRPASYLVPNNASTTAGEQSSLLNALLNVSTPSLYDLFVAHARARGKLVTDAASADTTFMDGGTVSPFDTATILSEYL